MNEVYVVNGVAHEIVNASHNVPGGRFLWIDVRCGAKLPPQLGPANVHEGAAVTCLFCLGYIEPEVDPPEEDGYADEDGSVYYDDDD